jgi:FMNH2-dependent dimethyl sulfone monooxygenase
MQGGEQRLEQLARTNPLFGPSKLKLGTFCTNASGGATMSTMDGVFELDWPNALHLARLADAMKFEAIVPVGRWMGFGGRTDFSGESYETMTFAAGIGAHTDFPSIFSTMHVPAMHPVMAAKQATTIDHISGGRFTLNIVCGWNKREIELFGAPIKEHDLRYEVGDEWITLMKLLWTSEEPVDFDGRFFQVCGALMKPRPVQRPYPALMSAGASPKGREFAAKHCDIAFAPLAERDPESIRARIDSYKLAAREQFGRELSIWINAYVFLGDSEADAQRYYDHCVHETGDWEGVENLIREMGISQQSHTPEMLIKLKEDFIAGWAGFRLQGTAARIVDDMQMFVDAGVDGVLLTFPAFIRDMERFQVEVHPLLAQAGLRPA